MRMGFQPLERCIVRVADCSAAEEVVAPVAEGVHEGEEFSFLCRVIAFSWRQFLGEAGYQTEVVFGVSLAERCTNCIKAGVGVEHKTFCHVGECQGACILECLAN